MQVEHAIRVIAELASKQDLNEEQQASLALLNALTNHPGTYSEVEATITDGHDRLCFNRSFCYQASSEGTDEILLEMSELKDKIEQGDIEEAYAQGLTREHDSRLMSEISVKFIIPINQKK